MKKYAHSLIVAFGLLALGASVASLYVHYQILADPSYTSFCDISETVSCEAVMTSQYGSVYGVPVSVGGAVWSSLVLLLGLVGMQSTRSAPQSAPPSKSTPKSASQSASQSASISDDAGRVAGYIFLLATVGTGVWAGSQSELEAELRPLKVSELIARMRKAEFMEEAIDLALDPGDPNTLFAAMYQRQRTG